MMAWLRKESHNDLGFTMTNPANHQTVPMSFLMRGLMMVEVEVEEGMEAMVKGQAIHLVVYQ